MRLTTLSIRLLTLLIPAMSFAQAPPPSAFPGEAPEGPEANIIFFEAERAVLNSGETATLSWEALNTYSLSISPNIGPVATRGIKTVTPEVTTTYVLTVNGTGGEKTQAVKVTVRGTEENTSQTTITSANPDVLANLSNGKPDLSGVYMGGRGVTLVDEISLKPGAEELLASLNISDLGAGVACVPPGVPNATMMPFPLQIVHKAGMMVIVYEAYNLVRIIPIGTPHSVGIYPTWMGNSVGFWEGDTLVVDVIGFNDKTLISGQAHTEDMHVIERYRRTSYGIIEYEAEVVDPDIFVDPVRYAGDFILHPEWEIGEYVCTENNKDYEVLFGTE